MPATARDIARLARDPNTSLDEIAAKIEAFAERRARDAGQRVAAGYASSLSFIADMSIGAPLVQRKEPA